MKHKRTRRATAALLIALVAALILVIALRIMQESRSATVQPEVISEQVTVKLEIPVIPTPTPVPTPEEVIPSQVTETPAIEEKPARVSRYINIEMTDEEYHTLACVIQLEAGNQSAEGQQAVAEVVFNRVVHGAFPCTVQEVLFQGAGTNCPQFSTIAVLHLAEPSQAQYDAIDAALYGDSILPLDVVFFSRGGENDRVWGQIGDHVFCYEYIWG